MKASSTLRLLVIIVGCLGVFALFTIRGPQPSAPPLSEAQIKAKEKLTNTLATLINAAGYDCRSVSSVLPYVSSEGFTVKCNSYRYTYYIENHGGRWSVKAE